MDGRFSRRDLLIAGCGAALTKATIFPPPGSYDKAYSFLGSMMDAYAQASTLRLIQSYSDQQKLASTAFTYDNAVCIFAFLVRGTVDDIKRAQVLGKALLYAQQNDRERDGRLRQAYAVDIPDANGTHVQPAAAPFPFLRSSTGDMAWVGMALAQLHQRTRDPRYLAGAVKLGSWIFDHAYDARGAGGYTGGVDASNGRITYKATEHNIDTYAFFSMLAALTQDHTWSTRAELALSFLTSMWNAAGEFFWTGTGTDGKTVNTENIPEDVQTWSFLALANTKYEGALDWTNANLATVDTPQSVNSQLSGLLRVEGMTFASQSLRLLTRSAAYDEPPDPNAVWLEGSAHAAAALLARRSPPKLKASDVSRARVLLDNIRLAQAKLGGSQTVGGRVIPSGEGVVAASSVCNTGFGSSYYPNLHIGATAWYLIAGQGANPFQLGHH